MCAALGMNVDAIGTYRAADLAAAGVKWARLVALPEVNAIFYLDELRDAGINTLLVLASESFHNAPWDEMCREYAHRYHGRIDAVQVANEPDIESPSSWTMHPNDLNRLLGYARDAFRQTILVGPGLASGQPQWVENIDLSLIDALGVHPYGQNVPNWGESPYGFDGHIGLLLNGYQRSSGKPLWVTEWGANANELGEERAAEYVEYMLDYLRDRVDVATAFYFCWHSRMVPKFGLLREDDSRSPSYDAFVSVSGGPLAVEPAQPQPAPSPEPAPETPIFAFAMGITRLAGLLGPALTGWPTTREFYPAPGLSWQWTERGKFVWSDRRKVGNKLEDPVVCFEHDESRTVYVLNEKTGSLTEMTA
jgi:hypothetical protein